MPHRPGHNRFGSSTGTTGGPAGMGSPPPSQNFGSNVVIGGNPGDAGGSTSGPPQGPVGGPPPPQSSPPPQGPVGGPPPPSPTPPPPDDDDKDKNILQEFDTMLGDVTTAAGKGIQNFGNIFGMDFPAFGFTGILQSLNANNKFFDRLIDGNVDAKDRVTLVGLLKANADNPRVFDQALEQYADRNNLSPDQRIALSDSFKSEVAGLERREEDFEKLVEQYESGRPKGFKEGVLSLTGQFDRESGITREELMNQLGPDGEAYLKATNPQLYYSFTSPQTSQGIEELASQSLQGLSNSPEDRRYAARIMEARALAADKRSRQNANMAGSSPAFAPPTQPGTPPGTQPPATPTPPGVTPVPAPPSRTPTPFDYSQFPQFDYKMGGLGTTPQFGDFNETLNRFFRFQ
jgi:hypothetical protein